MKLAADAYVVIVSSGKEITMSEVQQMLGRGCRSFGIAQGCFYTTAYKPNMNVDIVERLNKH